MKNLFTHWKTTSAGILAITGSVLTLVYGGLNPTTITAAVTGILTGLGLIFASDSTPDGLR